MELTFEAKAPAGQRVRTLKVRGEVISDSEKYSFAGCEREGEPLDFVCRLRGVHEVEYIEPTIHEAMEQSLLAQKNIDPARQHCSRAIDLPDKAFSQDQLLSSFST